MVSRPPSTSGLGDEGRRKMIGREAKEKERECGREKGIWKNKLCQLCTRAY